MDIKKGIIYTLLVCMVFCTSYGITALLSKGVVKHSVVTMADSLKREAGEAVFGQERINLLIMGNDARPGQGVQRSDTLMLASIDPRQKKAVFLFIPRDTRWTSSAHGVQKINAALAYDGPGGAVQAVSQLLNVKIDYYMMVDFESFRKIIDLLGGVEIDVPQDMYKASENIHIEKGLQVLNGEDALGFVRYRNYKMGDVDRSIQQQAFIKALARRIMDPAIIPRLPDLAMEAGQMLKTDMLLSDMVKYAAWVPVFGADSIVTQTLPGYFENTYDQNGTLIASYWIVSPAVANTVISDLYSGKTLEVFEAEPPGANIVVPGNAPQPETMPRPGDVESPGPTANPGNPSEAAPSPGSEPVAPSGPANEAGPQEPPASSSTEPQESPASTPGGPGEAQDGLPASPAPSDTGQ